MEFSSLVAELAALYGNLEGASLRCTFDSGLTKEGFDVLVERIRFATSNWVAVERYTLTEKVYADNLIDWSRGAASTSEKESKEEKSPDLNLEARIHERPYGSFTAWIEKIPVCVECYALDVRGRQAHSLPVIETRRRKRQSFSNRLLFSSTPVSFMYVVCCDEVELSTSAVVKRLVTLQIFKDWQKPVIEHAPFIVYAVYTFIQTLLKTLPKPYTLSKAESKQPKPTPKAEPKRKAAPHPDLEKVEEMIRRFRQSPNMELEVRVGTRLASGGTGVFSSGVDEDMFWRSFLRYMRTYPKHRVVEAWVDSFDRYSGELRATTTRETTLATGMKCILKAAEDHVDIPLSALANVAAGLDPSLLETIWMRISLDSELPRETKEFMDRPQDSLRVKRRFTVQPNDKFRLSWSIVMQLAIDPNNPREASMDNLLQNGTRIFEYECEYISSTKLHRYSPSLLARQSLEHIVEMMKTT